MSELQEVIVRNSKLAFFVFLFSIGLFSFIWLCRQVVQDVKPEPVKWCRLVMPATLQDIPGHFSTDQPLLGIGQNLHVLRHTEVATPRGNTDPAIRYYQVEFDTGGAKWTGFVPEKACEIFFVIPVK